MADRRNPQIDTLELQKRIAAQFGPNDARTAAILDGCRSDNPARTPWGMLVATTSDVMNRTPMRRAAEARAEAGGAPAFLGNFAWASPLEGGIWGRAHAVDVPCAFGDLEPSRFASNADPRTASSSLNMMSAFAAFISGKKDRM